jgi:hypothetical protein
MIRPVLYVDLPGIIYTIDNRARSRQRAFANFVCWLEPLEHALPQSPLLSNLLPFRPVARTWICEDHWRLLGFAQVRERPSHTAWDLSYLASIANRNLVSEDILNALLEYMLEMAATHGILRVFTKVEDGIPETALFSRAGFQRYARECSYVYDPTKQQLGTDLADAETAIPSLRRWNRHHVWGLYQLYRSVTPQRVMAAEHYENSEEYARLHAGSLKPFLSVFARGNENYVCDVGLRLGAWLRLYRGHGSSAHRIALIVHPEHRELAEPLLQFGIRKLLGIDVRRIYCLVREYDSGVITALRDSGFEQASIKMLLVRHVALRATRQSTVPLLEQRAVYGLKGLGTVSSRQKIMR